MKKIGLLISGLGKGGAERVVSRLSFILSDYYDIYVILFSDKNKEYDCGGKVVSLDVAPEVSSRIRALFIPLKRIIRLRKVKKQLGLDAVISFMDSPNIVNILSHSKNCRAIVSVRNYPGLERSSTAKARKLDFFSKRLYRYSDQIIAVSKEIESFIKKNYKGCENKVSTIYNPFDYNSIEEQRKMPITNVNHKGFMTEHRCIISVGRNMFQKGFWHLFKAFSVVHEKIPESGLVIVGPDILAEKAKRLVDQLGISDCVLMAGDQDNPFSYIDAAEVYVMPSLFEGFPNALVEAMMCGKPVIATNCKSGPKEILAEDENLIVAHDYKAVKYGIVIPEAEQNENWNAGDIEELDTILSEAIYHFMTDKCVSDEYAAKARERSLSFSYETCRKRFIKLIDRMIAL